MTPIAYYYKKQILTLEQLQNDADFAPLTEQPIPLYGNVNIQPQLPCSSDMWILAGKLDKISQRIMDGENPDLIISMLKKITKDMEAKQ